MLVIESLYDANDNYEYEVMETRVVGCFCC